MSAPTLVTADIHLAENPRDAYRFVFFEELLPRLIREHGVGRLLVLGDLTEQKSGHGPRLVNRMVDGFAALAELADVYLLKGNHDFLAEDVPFYRFLGHLERVRWINEPTSLRLRGLGDCLFLPYTRNLEDWVDLMRAEHDWFFCHQTFRGADLGQGVRADGAAPAPFARGTRVISGDVHVPQKIGPVAYVGSPYPVDFGDDFEPRVLLLGDGGKVRSIPVAGPQKQLVEIADLAQLREAGRAVRPGDVVKVRISLGADDSRPAARRAVQEWANAAGVTLAAVQVLAPAAGRAAPSRNRPQQSDEELIRAYVRRMKRGRTVETVGLKIAEETP